MEGILLGVYHRPPNHQLHSLAKISAKPAYVADEWNESVRKIQYLDLVYGAKKILGYP
jgi:hypothetical protein